MGNQHQITPSELVELALAFQDAWGAPMQATLTFDRARGGKEQMQLLVKVSVERNGSVEPVEFRSSLQWPTSTHSSVLAALVWLMHNVDQQIDAYRVLEQFGA